MRTHKSIYHRVLSFLMVFVMLFSLLPMGLIPAVSGSDSFGNMTAGGDYSSDKDYFFDFFHT